MTIASERRTEHSNRGLGSCAHRASAKYPALSRAATYVMSSSVNTSCARQTDRTIEPLLLHLDRHPCATCANPLCPAHARERICRIGRYSTCSAGTHVCLCDGRAVFLGIARHSPSKHRAPGWYPSCGGMSNCISSSSVHRQVRWSHGHYIGSGGSDGMPAGTHAGMRYAGT